MPSPGAGRAIIGGTARSGWVGFALGLGFLMVTLPARADITTSLQGYWPMDEGAGTTSTADSANANTGVLGGSTKPAWKRGYRSWGLLFDGSTSYINAGTNSSLNMTSAVTISAWIYPTNVTGFHAVVSRQYLNSGNDTFWFGVKDGTLEWLANGFTTYSVGTISTNRWTHIAVTYNGTTITFYVNGAAVSSTAQSGSFSNDGNYTCIGCNVNTATVSDVFTGRLDEVRMYSRALTAADILQLSEGTMTGIPKFWISAGANNFSAASTWATTADAISSDTVTPTSNDRAIFTAGGAGNCTISASITVNRLDIQASHTTGSVSQSASMTITTNKDFEIAAGTFSGGNSTITVKGNFLQSGGAFTSTSGTLEAQGDFTNTGGTFTHNSGTLQLTSSAAATITTGGVSFNNVIVGSAETGLAGYWKLDESSSPAVDSSTTGLNGTWTNTPTAQTGAPAITFTNAKSLKFVRASRQAVQMASAPAALKPTAVSMAVWFKSGPSMAECEIISMGDYYMIHLTDSTTIKVIRHTSTGWDETSAATVSNYWDGNWHHIVGIYDPGNNRTDIYLDGVSKVPGNDSRALDYTAGAGGTDLWLGRHGNGNTSFDLDGYLDDARIYNRGLSTAEISNLYSGYLYPTGVNATGTYTLSGTLKVIGNITLQSGTLSAGSNTINVGGNWSNTGGTFTAGTGTVLFNGTASGKTITPNGNNFYNVTLSGSGGVWTLAGAMTVTNDLTLTNGTLDVSASNYALSIGGSFATSSGTFTCRSGTVTLTSTTTGETLSLNTSNLYKLTINGSGGYWTMGSNVTVTNLLAVTAGTIDTSSFTLNASLATSVATVTSGTLYVGSGTATMAGGLTVSSTGAVTLGGTGILNIGSTKTFTMDGTLTATGLNYPTIQSSGGNGTTYVFTINSAAPTMTATLNIDGLNVKHTDTSGMNIKKATQATFTKLQNIHFTNGISTANSPYLNITSDNLYLNAPGCTFDAPGVSTKNVSLTGNGTTDGFETRAYFEDRGSATSGAGAGEARDIDDDPGNDGVGDTAASNAAVVQWIWSAKTDMAGTVEGFPTAAFNWSNFSYYATYVAYRSSNGSNDRIYVRNADGDAPAANYYWEATFATDGHVVGTPRWLLSGSNRYVFVVTTVGKVYKLLDDSTAHTLTAVANWPYQFNATQSTGASSPVIDSTNIYWSGDATTGSKRIFKVDFTATTPALATSWVTSAAGDTTTAPGLATVSLVNYLFFAVSGHFYRLKTSDFTPLDVATATGAITGRVSVWNNLVYAADDVGKVWVRSAVDFSASWSYQGTAAHGGSCAGTPSNCRIQNFIVSPFDTGVSSPRVYWGDHDGHVYAVYNSSGTGTVIHSGFPMQPSSGVNISVAPLYSAGILVVGNDNGEVFVINESTTALGNPTATPYTYKFNSAISSISRDPSTNGNAGAYLIGTASGKLYYIPVYTDPDSYR